MANKNTHEDDPIDLLGDDAIPPSRSAQSMLTETSNMNQRLAVMTESNQVSAEPKTVSTEVDQLRLSEWIGQRKFSAALQKLLTVSDLVEFQKIKESKSYKGLRLLIDGKLLTVSKFGDLCSSIGCSEQHINEQLLNLKTFGPEFLEFADKSLGYRELRALRKLPDDQHDALRVLAKSNNTDALVEFVEKTIESHLSEKSSLHEEIKELGETIGNHQKQYDKLSTEHENVSREHNRLTRTKKPGESTYNARTFEVRHESAALEYGSRIHVDALEVMLDAVWGEDSPAQERELQLHALGLAAGALYARAESFYLRIKTELGDVMPIQPSSKYMLHDDERSRLDASVSMIDVNFHRKKGAREYERNEDAPVGRGRPKGSKNKDKEAE